MQTCRKFDIYAAEAIKHPKGSERRKASLTIIYSGSFRRRMLLGETRNLKEFERLNTREQLKSNFPRVVVQRSRREPENDEIPFNGGKGSHDVSYEHGSFYL